jgi:hypothetical protein
VIYSFFSAQALRRADEIAHPLIAVITRATTFQKTDPIQFCFRAPVLLFLPSLLIFPLCAADPKIADLKSIV